MADLTPSQQASARHYMKHGRTEREAIDVAVDQDVFLSDIRARCKAQNKENRRKENWEIFRAIPRFLMGFGMYSSDPQIARDSMVYMATCAAEDHAKAQQEQVDAIREQTAQQQQTAATQAQLEEERMLRMARAMAREMFDEAERRKAAA